MSRWLERHPFVWGALSTLVWFVTGVGLAWLFVAVLRASP